LKFIQIQRQAWQVVKCLRPSPTPEESYFQVELRELEPEEMLSNDLFAIENFPQQSGLSGRERPTKEMSEEEELHIEQIMAQVTEAYDAGTLPSALHDL
jgi:hypothetical protein